MEILEIVQGLKTNEKLPALLPDYLPRAFIDEELRDELYLSYLPGHLLVILLI